MKEALEGEGVQWTGSLGLADANYCIWSVKAMRSCCIAQGTISNHLRWNMMDDTMRKTMMSVHNWVTLLYNRN